jgi:hypothetical protein
MFEDRRIIAFGRCRRERHESNEEIFDRIKNDPAFRNLAPEQFMRDVCERLRNHEPPAARA